ncbi:MULTISPECIES: maleylpyruvate isomerase family mycothiol-dependent enzyme [Kitasatospora]|uniref:Maleylpyruvate isomerase family mycothiol-dependent enzyme n=1 Tax=Kitasatospora cathayae TaxID=3004092 RepID=A0ABY7QEF7_9ACTN|nr:maleylpyruvate isomerase family mycothiol-dependent enzyme [Kitasatospora sp. HUAS 3-15]WBP91139.1 maleylpyruvate isomerase family mycothiol-dependent enzyme [Kitasatospora sp. HUAS 3-15]
MNAPFPPHRPGAARTALFETVTAVGDEAVALLAGCRGDTSIPGSEWTVAEAAAHLAMANELMAALAAGEERPYGDGTPGSLAAANAAALAERPERDPAVLAAQIARQARQFTAAAAPRTGTDPVATPLGEMDLDTLGAYLLTHMLAHLYDIALALHRPHPLDRRRVGLTMPFLRTAMPRVVDARTAAGHSACYHLRVRALEDFAVTFTDGTAVVSRKPPRRPDCTILTEPVAFFLIALGRHSATDALLRGKVLAWGRRPWLAPAFARLFTAP